jgi:undecaprenyl diphosphate synthase
LRHVAIIMDGNGRWAKARGVSRLEGHQQGVEAARRAVEVAKELGLTHITLYSFSTENWNRPDWEVRHLMGLLRRFFEDDLSRLAEEGVRVRIIGDRASLPQDLRRLVEDAERRTAQNQGYTLQIAFNYGGRDEIVRAAAKLAARAAAGEIDAGAIDEAALTGALDTGDAPDPDLVIRTSGEQRISNFLLWQAAYAEFVFLDCLWPDFDREAFLGAVEAYRSRDRRYGGRREEGAG